MLEITPKVNIEGIEFYPSVDGLSEDVKASLAVGIAGRDGKDGKDGKDGYTPVKGTDYYTATDKAEMVSAVIAALPVEYTAGDNIKIENNVISVLTADEASEDNTRPITSAAVNSIVGNIEVLLETI